jgi:diguanylate cyclase (GGDEF)-like protein/PAS domain S-box-containing protein
MGRRDIYFTARKNNESAPAVHAGVDFALERAQLFVECTRAILRANADSDLVEIVCQLLVRPRLYAEACIGLAHPAQALRRSAYAGWDKRCLADAARFWHAPRREAAFQAALASPASITHDASALAFAISVHGHAVGALVLVPRAGRTVEEGERRELESLVDDLSLALERLRAHEARDTLAAREKRVRQIFENAGVGITSIDMGGRFVEVNQKFCEMLGYTREELIGRPTRDFTVPEDYGPGPAFRDQVRLGRATVLAGEKRYIHKNGSHVWVRRTMSAARNDDGTAQDAISIVEDITERKKAEEAARSERHLLRAIIDALPDYIYVKDAEGRFRVGNTAWLKARNLTPEAVQGKTVFDIYPPAIARRMDDKDRQLMLSGKTLVEEEVPLEVVDSLGNRVSRWSFTTKVPIRDDRGNITGIVGISRDITDRRRMERERAMEHGVARVLSDSRSIGDTMPLLLRTMCEALDWVYAAYWTWDPETQRLKRSGWWCGFEPELEPEDARYWTEVIRPSGKGLVGRAWRSERPTWVSDIANMPDFKRQATCRKLGWRSAYAFPICTRDERLGVVEFFARDVREPDEALLEVSGAISRQVGQFIRRKRAEESLQESEQQLRAMFDNAAVGIAVTALDMQYLRVNDKYCSLVGYSRDELLRMRTSDVNFEANIDAMREYRERMMREHLPSIIVEKQLVRKDGTPVWASIATSLVRASDGSPRYFIAVLQDISESKRAAQALKVSEEQYRRLAQFDSLTGLPNRALLYDRLEHGIAQGRRNRDVLAVLFIDLDRFKYVNDTFGHSAGDELLKQVAERFSQCVRSEDTVGRLSGDEFAIVLARIAVPEDAALVAKKVVDSLNRPFQLQGVDLFVTASIGITVFPTDGTDRDALIRNADVAMYRAKERGRNNYQFYTPEMNNRTREMLDMQNALRGALERNELVLHYQPKIDLLTGRVSGIEALLRWAHPKRGLIPPAEFMPMLEETGLIVRAGDWVVSTVCRQLSEWRRAGVKTVPVAINLSARQFLAPDLGPAIRSAIDEHGLAPELLEIEITESSIMADTEEAIRTLEYLQLLGVKTAIDDFGTGYSSLGYLKRFPLRALKIDRTFVRDITTDADDATITQAVISMAHSLNLKVIAEGVESSAQLAFLMRYGCDEVQGYLFSRPVPPEECVAFICNEVRIREILQRAAG